MSPRAFIDAGYALIVNEFLRIPGKTLFEAIEATNESFGIPKPVEAQIADEAAQNEASLAQLNAILGAVS